MINVGMVVTNNKGLKGTITKIITKSTGYVEVLYDNGIKKKEIAFNLVDENGVPLKKVPKAPAPKKLTPLEDAMDKLMWINGLVYGDRRSVSYQISEEMYATIELAAKDLGDTKIVSICQSVMKYMKCSDKQAYVLAKFVVDNKLQI